MFLPDVAGAFVRFARCGAGVDAADVALQRVLCEAHG
jgi:hypothetical protein